MNERETRPDIDAVSPYDLEGLEVHVREALSGRVRDFKILVQACGSIILRGLARSYHAKQLAQHAVMMETNLPILRNEIEVC